MKKLIIVALVLLSIQLKAQFSYGIIAGGFIYNANSKDVYPVKNYGDSFLDSGSINYVTTNFGGYIEYELTNNMGIKTEITYSKLDFERTIPELYDYGLPQIESRLSLSYVDINPNFKYDFGKTYRKGFYMMLGPRFSILTSAKENGANVKPAYENMVIGAQLGLGQRILKVIELEGKFDYGLTPLYKAGNSESRSFGFYLSLNADISRIITGK